jgi:hypothetical protein
MIEDEWLRTADVLQKITDCAELLDDIPWLKRSITARNGYVDPLNLVQMACSTSGPIECCLLRRANFLDNHQLPR